MTEEEKFNIDKIAELTRLSVNDEDKAELKEQMKKILSMVEEIEQVDTNNVKPLLSVLDNKNIWREDEIKDSLPIKEALLNAPERIDEFLIVPKVIDKE